MRAAALVAMPTVLVIAYLYQEWVIRGRKNSFAEELRTNLFALLAFIFSLIMLSMAAK